MPDRKTAIVTGASSGIGAEIARQLAERGYDLVVVARRRERLEALAKEIEGKRGVRVTPLAIDLSVPGAVAEVHARTEGAGMEVDVLVNNAGFGTHGFFPEIPWEKSSEQLRLNVLALTEASWLFARSMRARRRGHILNVASIGAYLPVPGLATYSAGKSYIRNFSEALAFELSRSGVKVCCLCPGPTDTEFGAIAGTRPPTQAERATFMSAERCARIGLQALFGGRRLIVGGLWNSIGMWLLRFVPRRMITWIAAMAMDGPRPS